MPDRSGQTYYEILEVRTDASFEEIEASYRGMLSYLAADSVAMYSMMEDEELERLRAQVDEAYRTLKDPERRAAYDRSIGRAESSYPTLLVPQQASDSDVTLATSCRPPTRRTRARPPPPPRRLRLCLTRRGLSRPRRPRLRRPRHRRSRLRRRRAPRRPRKIRRRPSPRAPRVRLGLPPLIA